MYDILKLPYHKIKLFLKKKQFTVKELTRCFLDRIVNNRFNAFNCCIEDSAIKQANISDDLFYRGKERKLEGLAFAVKDNFCTQGVRTTASSKILENFTPNYESTTTYKMFIDGAIMIGKTNMDEFAVGSFNTTSYFGKVFSSYKTSYSDLVSGGSSGGSAVAVSSNLSSIALASDTGGSVRLPAAFNGVVGLKPTYGRCSRFGIVSFASSLDQPSILANDVTDSALVLESICGFDLKDSSMTTLQTPRFLDFIENNTFKLKKVALLSQFINTELEDSINISISICKQIFIDEGAIIIEKSLPNLQYTLAAYYIISSSEISSNLSRYDGIRYGARVENISNNFESMAINTRSECLGHEVQTRILSGTYALSSKHINDYFNKAKEIRHLIYHDLLNILDNVDIIITPTFKTFPFSISSDKIKSYMYDIDAFTVPFSLAGLPAISIPITYSAGGLPVGVQIVSKHFDEKIMLLAARIIERNIIFSN